MRDKNQPPDPKGDTESTEDVVGEVRKPEEVKELSVWQKLFILEMEQLPNKPDIPD
jgi:hypothetical protein